MKKFYMFLLVFGILVSTVGCSTANETSEANIKIKPVRVTEVKEETFPVTLNYLGLVDTKTVKKYSFKSPGKINRIFVEKGQKIKKGDKLAQLDIKDLAYSLDAAKAQLDGAQAQYDKALKGASDEKIKQAELNVNKAQEAYNYANNYYLDMKDLYDKGAISEQDLNKAELEKNLRLEDLNIAKQVEAEAKKEITFENKQMLQSQINQAKANYDQKKGMLDDAIITSDVDGYVLDVLYKSGEFINAGYPVIAVRNENSVVNVGLTQEDIDKVSIGLNAKIKANGKSVEGRIDSIDSVPDQKTRTFNVEIELSDSTFRIGTITDVTVYLSEKRGIFVPITSIQKNGDTYVYIVDENQIVKKQIITVESSLDSNVLVSGLKTGDKVVVEGIKRISEGDKVNIQP